MVAHVFKTNTLVLAETGGLCEFKARLVCLSVYIYSEFQNISYIVSPCLKTGVVMVKWSMMMANTCDRRP